MSVRISKILCLLTLLAGCGDEAANRDSPQPPISKHPVEVIPPLLPITISDVLQLPDIAVYEARGIGPGLRFWHLNTRNGTPFVYAEAYDEPFLTKLEISVDTSEAGTIVDHLKMIHETFSRLRPEDRWFMTTWPESDAGVFSLPASAAHDGVTLDVSREEKWTKLTVTATELVQKDSE